MLSVLSVLLSYNRDFPMNVSMHEQRILREFALVGSIHSKRLENGNMEAIIVDKAVHAVSDGRKVEATLCHLR